MSRTRFPGISAIVVTLVAVATARAQHDFTNTKTVDPSGNADFTTIQAAIDDLSMPSVRGTVLIYSGTYAENLTLGTNDENIDLVGIDKEGVIIAPSSGAGIVITSGTETSRNNRIANLTIRTTSGHGIQIVKGGTPDAADITIDAVTIEADGSGGDGVNAEDAKNIRITNSDISSDDGNGLRIDNTDEVFVENSRLVSPKLEGFSGRGICNDLTVLGCNIFGGHSGVRFLHGDRILFQDCVIVADNADSGENQITGLFIDRLSGGGTPPSVPGNIAAISCSISATATGQSSAGDFVQGVSIDTDTFPLLVDCTIRVTADAKPVYGVFSGGGIGLDPVVSVIGGVITTHCDDEKETEVWDLRRNNPQSGTGTLKMAGTRCSKWRGPIESAERSRDVTQRTVGVAASSATAVLGSTALTGAEQSVTAGITDPDVFRVVSATGYQAGMTQDVLVIGTDWANNLITDKITLNGTATVAGVKPFKTVSKIILQAQSAPLQAVSVGTTSKLGLEFPLALSRDVLQQGRKASAGASYTLEAVGTVDLTYATVDVSSITANDSFEFYAIASQ